MKACEIKPGDWVKLKIYRLANSDWFAAWMNDSAQGPHLGSSWNPRNYESREYWFPVREINKEFVQVFLPSHRGELIVRVDGHLIDLYCRQYYNHKIRHAYMHESLILAHTNNPTLCIDCNWMCAQQCFSWQPRHFRADFNRKVIHYSSSLFHLIKD